MQATNSNYTNPSAQPFSRGCSYSGFKGSPNLSPHEAADEGLPSVLVMGICMVRMRVEESSWRLGLDLAYFPFDEMFHLRYYPSSLDKPTFSSMDHEGSLL